MTNKPLPPELRDLLTGVGLDDVDLIKKFNNPEMNVYRDLVQSSLKENIGKGIDEFMKDALLKQTRMDDVMKSIFLAQVIPYFARELAAITYAMEPEYEIARLNVLTFAGHFQSAIKQMMKPKTGKGPRQ